MPVERYIACQVCQRPLDAKQSWKRKLSGGKVLHYCAEHVIITEGGHGWRPRTKDDPDDLPPMGTPTKVAEPDIEPMTSIAEMAAESLEQGLAFEKTSDPPDAPRFEDEWRGSYDVERPETPAAAAAPIVEHLKQVIKPPVDDFDPINDVGF